jgi:hypothetical protein
MPTCLCCVPSVLHVASRCSTWLGHAWAPSSVPSSTQPGSVAVLAYSKPAAGQLLVGVHARLSRAPSPAVLIRPGMQLTCTALHICHRPRSHQHQHPACHSHPAQRPAAPPATKGEGRAPRARGGPSSSSSSSRRSRRSSSSSRPVAAPPDTATGNSPWPAQPAAARQPAFLRGLPAMVTRGARHSPGPGHGQ